MASAPPARPTFIPSLAYQDNRTALTWLQRAFYGERAYVAADLEGHYWTFSQPVRTVSRQEMEQATGLRFELLR